MSEPKELTWDATVKEIKASVEKIVEAKNLFQRFQDSMYAQVINQECKKILDAIAEFERT